MSIVARFNSSRRYVNTKLELEDETKLRERRKRIKKSMRDYIKFCQRLIQKMRDETKLSKTEQMYAYETNDCQTIIEAYTGTNV